MTLPPRSASLAPFFNPSGVAVIGASRDPTKLSYGVMRNLLDPETGFPGPVYPVNPKADEIMGLRCYPDISAVPDPVELAVLLIPALHVPRTIAACGQRGLKAAVVISGGFREVGPDGAALEREMVEIARRYGLRVMGPNGIGVIDTRTPLNTTFVRGMPPRGGIAFLSQSGALCGGVIDCAAAAGLDGKAGASWTLGQGIGFSRLLSVGNEADVNETDVIPFLASDDASRVLALYLEDVKGGPDFVEALRQAAARKPVVILKSGRTSSGQAATASHTGALAGAHDAFRAACRRAGAIEIETIRGLFHGAAALEHQPLPAGNRIAILTNSGGPAALAADCLEEHGLELACTSQETRLGLEAVLHPEAQTAGPVDMLGGADEDSYRSALDLALADPACDGVLAILVPQVLVNPAKVVNAVASAAARQAAPGKPVLLCLMGEASLDEAYSAARAASLPAYTFPEDAVGAFAVLWRRQEALCELAAPVPPRSDAERVAAAKGRRKAQEVLLLARSAGRRALDASECLALLEAYGIPMPPQTLATDPADAVAFAERIGYPVALKIVSPDILHKTDVGGVVLGVSDEQGVRAAFDGILARARAAHPQAPLRGVQVQKMASGGHEVIIGVTRDPTFGPLVMFGLGGVYVEALRDVSFRLAPLTRADAEEMIDEVRSARLLAGLRGAPSADRTALADAIVRIGQLAADHPEIAEMDVNPLAVFAAGQGALALDARVVLAVTAPERN
jgi:acetyltransferase